MTTHIGRKFSAPMNGIIGGDPTNTRTFSVLDAIASIAICKPNGQVVAVALQMDHKHKKICLTIAQNGQASREVINHIKKVWEMLRELSDHYANHRSVVRDPGYNEKSSKMHITHSATFTKQRIGVEVYKFSCQNVLKRFKNWKSTLMEFSNTLVEALLNGSLGGDEEDKALQDKLLRALGYLAIAFKWNRVPPDADVPPIKD
jgi:hemerythrin